MAVISWAGSGATSGRGGATCADASRVRVVAEHRDLAGLAVAGDAWRRCSDAPSRPASSRARFGSMLASAPALMSVSMAPLAVRPRSWTRAQKSCRLANGPPVCAGGQDGFDGRFADVLDGEQAEPDVARP